VTKPKIAARPIVPLVVTLGKPATEEVSKGRLALFRWLGRQITKEVCVLEPPRGTIYVDFNQLQFEPEVIRKQIAKINLNRRHSRAIVLLDLSQNQYGILSDPFLYHVALESRDIVAQGKERFVAILLPDLPADGSIFWLPFHDTALGPLSDRIVVISNTGEHRWLIGERQLRKTFAKEYGKRQNDLAGYTMMGDQFRSKIVRKVGHFELVREGESECARYFFDASMAIEELSHLLQDRFQAIARQADEQLCVLAHDDERSPWLVQSAMLATDALDIQVIPLPPLSEIASKHISPNLSVLCVGVASTGATFRLLIRRLSELGARLAPRAVAAIGTRLMCSSEDGSVRLESLVDMDNQSVSRSECIQCRLGLPYSNPMHEEYLQLRAFDLWDMIQSYEWKEEEYGPAGARLFRETPDLERVFKAHGGWLAYKIDVLLANLGVRNEVVVVCPDEGIINELVAMLRPRFKQRLVAVQVPRPVLDSITDGERLPSIDEAHEEGWRRQLRHLAKENSAQVVLLDEFNASGDTARAMYSLLGSFGIRPIAYVPVINRKPSFSLGTVPVTSLYDLPAPR
jgi:hypothetical protein